MNRAKAEFFDTQVNEPWAASEFGEKETNKIKRMLRHGGLRPGSQVIEPGCGTGRLTGILADAVGPTGLVFACDISPDMVEAACCRVGSRDNVRIECMPVEDYRFDPESFDVVVCNNVFPHFDNKPRAVFHLASALKPSGRFVVFHFMSSAEINDLHRKADPSVINDLLPPEQEVREMFQAAGLQVELLEDDDDGYLLCSVRQ